jgi:hypothetical protein
MPDQQLELHLVQRLNRRPSSLNRSRDHSLDDDIFQPDPLRRAPCTTLRAYEIVVLAARMDDHAGKVIRYLIQLGLHIPRDLGDRREQIAPEVIRQSQAQRVHVSVRSRRSDDRVDLDPDRIRHQACQPRSEVGHNATVFLARADSRAIVLGQPVDDVHKTRIDGDLRNDCRRRPAILVESFPGCVE